MRLAVLERVEQNRTEMALDVARVRYPAGVRRPRRVDVPRRIVVRVAIDLRRLATRDVERPEAEVIVLQQEALAVGRPDRREVIAHGRQRHRARLREATLVPDHELILTTRVREPGELRAVWRPDRTVLVCARG